MIRFLSYLFCVVGFQASSLICGSLVIMGRWLELAPDGDGNFDWQRMQIKYRNAKPLQDFTKDFVYIHGRWDRYGRWREAHWKMTRKGARYEESLESALNEKASKRLRSVSPPPPPLPPFMMREIATMEHPSPPQDPMIDELKKRSVEDLNTLFQTVLELKKKEKLETVSESGQIVPAGPASSLGAIMPVGLASSLGYTESTPIDAIDVELLQSLKRQRR